MKVCLITATKNRHTQLERVVRFSLNQTVDNWIHLIYNNSNIDLSLDDDLSSDKYILVNKPICTSTNKPYETLGDIYNDIMEFIPEDCDILNFMDDDDIFLPNHVEEGLKGLEKGGLKAYKPSHSYFKQISGVSLVQNTLEPSIFVKKSHVKQHGFSQETTAQHLKWLNPLVYDREIFVDQEGVPTYICDWSQQIPTFKTSGDPNNPSNFSNYSSWSKDIGDGIITPCSNSKAQIYYKTNI